MEKKYSIRIGDTLLDLSEPQVMGILNCTPDSFFSESRMQRENEIAHRAQEIIEQGGTIIDIGACSTRPGGEVVSEDEEIKRLRFGLAIVRREHPNAIVSVDTFRPSVARMCVEEFGVNMITDVAEGEEPGMFETIANLRVPYILMSVQSNLHDSMRMFARKTQTLFDLGVSDVILDPGFGFGKTLEENYVLLNELEKLHELSLPLLVGISRKSMIYRLMGTTPEEALNGTTVLNTIALLKGAHILRVHDVKEAVETCKLVELTRRRVDKLTSC